MQSSHCTQGIPTTETWFHLPEAVSSHWSEPRTILAKILSSWWLVPLIFQNGRNHWRLSSSERAGQWTVKVLCRELSVPNFLLLIWFFKPSRVLLNLFLYIFFMRKQLPGWKATWNHACPYCSSFQLSWDHLIFSKNSWITTRQGIKVNLSTSQWPGSILGSSSPLCSTPVSDCFLVTLPPRVSQPFSPLPCWHPNLGRTWVSPGCQQRPPKLSLSPRLVFLQIILQIFHMASEIFSNLSTHLYLSLKSIQWFLPLCAGWKYKVLSMAYKSRPLTISGHLGRHRAGSGSPWLPWACLANPHSSWVSPSLTPLTRLPAFVSLSSPPNTRQRFPDQELTDCALTSPPVHCRLWFLEGRPTP